MGRMKRKRGGPDADGLSPNAKREKEDFFWKRGEAKCRVPITIAAIVSIMAERGDGKKREGEITSEGQRAEQRGLSVKG